MSWFTSPFNLFSAIEAVRVTAAAPHIQSKKLWSEKKWLFFITQQSFSSRSELFYRALLFLVVLVLVHVVMSYISFNCVFMSADDEVTARGSGPGPGSAGFRFRRGRSPSAGLKVSAEPLRCGGSRPDPAVQHLQRWLQVTPPHLCHLWPDVSPVFLSLTSNPSLCLTCLPLSAALEVELSDDSFPPEDFGIVSGMLNVKWDRIAPYPSSLSLYTLCTIAWSHNKDI